MKDESSAARYILEALDGYGIFAEDVDIEEFVGLMEQVLDEIYGEQRFAHEFI